MRDLVLEPTSVAQWKALINASSELYNIELSETVEAYLVFMLMRFSTRPFAFARVMALDFLSAQQAEGYDQIGRLQDMADCSLLIAGLFPQQAERRLVKPRYFVELAQSGYQQLADLPLTFRGEISQYRELTSRTVDMVLLLSGTREIDAKHTSELALKAWQETLAQDFPIQ